MPVASWTDALLALCAGLLAWVALRTRTPGAQTLGLGLAFVSAAATVGTARFAGHEVLAPLHQVLSSWAATVGLPLVGLGWCGATLAPRHAEAIRRFALPALWLSGLFLGSFPTARTLLGGAGMLLVLVSAASMLRRAPKVALLGACGASLTVGVGLGIGTEGDLMGFPRIGWFHLGLALGTVGLAGALRIPASPSA